MAKDLNQISLRNKYLHRNAYIKYIIPKEEFAVTKGDFDNLNLLRHKVRTYLRTSNSFVKNEATGFVAKITMQTVNKIIYPASRFNVFKDAYIYNLNAALNLCTLFRNAIYIDTLPPMKNKKNNVNELGYHHFVAPIILFNRKCRALITVREKINSKILYIVSIEIISCYYDLKEAVSVAELIDNVRLWDYDKSEYISYDISNFVCSDDYNEFYNNVLRFFILK